MKKTWTLREFRKLLKANGFEEVRSKGDHFIFSDGGRNLSINKEPNRMVVQRLIKEYQLQQAG